MTYDLNRLTADVLMRMGEVVRPQSTSDLHGIPTPSDAVAARIRSQLPLTGGRLILEAPPAMLGEGELPETDSNQICMPCGMAGTDINLPSDTLRVVSVSIGDAIIPGSSLVGPESGAYMRQYSPESGIAGSPERPMCYLLPGGVLRVVGTGPDAAVSVRIWRVPEADEEGNFRFPEKLYAELVGQL